MKTTILTLSMLQLISSVSFAFSGRFLCTVSSSSGTSYNQSVNTLSNTELQVLIDNKPVTYWGQIELLTAPEGLYTRVQDSNEAPQYISFSGCVKQ